MIRYYRIVVSPYGSKGRPNGGIQQHVIEDECVEFGEKL